MQAIHMGSLSRVLEEMRMSSSRVLIPSLLNVVHVAPVKLRRVRQVRRVAFMLDMLSGPFRNWLVLARVQIFVRFAMYKCNDRI